MAWTAHHPDPGQLRLCMAGALQPATATCYPLRRSDPALAAAGAEGCAACELDGDPMQWKYVGRAGASAGRLQSPVREPDVAKPLPDALSGGGREGIWAGTIWGPPDVLERV
ncbi:hypothetical protein C8Q76DRAFT_688517 [Earliella scabrosa]|nr:hypothetical protein C8Q76DRAFT_688517 [Earliella scabrosa]